MQGEYIEISGTVNSVIYQNEENGYTVLRMGCDDGNVVTAVGCLPGAAAGEELVLTGSWSTHPSFGEQFKSEWAERRLPQDAAGIYDYLAFGAIKGIGPVTAKAIVDAFGDETLDIIEANPDRLAELKGITPKKAREIGDAFRRQASLRRLMDFLVANSLKPQLAMRLYKCYGDGALAAVRDNPYILTDDFFGAKFSEADALALNLGFDDDNPQRIEAAIIFELNHNLGNGHCFIPRQKLIAATAALLDTEPDLVDDALEILSECGDIVYEEIAGQEAVYLRKIHEAETYVAQRILDMTEGSASFTGDMDNLLSAIEKEQGIQYAPEQRRAAYLAAGSRIMILTGGPGTGKTTSVRGILAMFDKLGLDTALAAPTGRAAKRLSELTGREAATVHRLLGAGYTDGTEEMTFERCEDDPLDADAVILDETSMVDITLMQALLSAMKPHCRLIMVGDADQLPSVGPGNLFSDIIRSEAVETVKLTEIFRQAEESRIVRSAHMINRGELPDLSDNTGDFFFLRRREADRAVETIIELCKTRLPKNMGIEPSQIQVLSPTRRYETGTVNLNFLLQEALNPPLEGKNEKIFGDFVFREGDRVMQIRNNYDIIWKNADGSTVGTGVFNGDVGIIAAVDKRADTITVDFEDKLVTYTGENLNELEPAYAMTVHKSQGSEYKAVILAAHKGASRLMTRSILYTAVTRARDLLIIVGDRGVVETMTANSRRQKRYSALKTRLTFSS